MPEASRRLIGEAVCLGEPVGMHEDHEAELFAPGKDLAKPFGPQILAGDMGHDLDAAEAQRFVQSLKLGDREIGRLKRHLPRPTKQSG
jgi:hypothetical protein